MTPIRPSPFPDEIASGYKGRILRHNGWIDEKDAMHYLLEWSGCEGTSLRHVSTVEILAKIAGMEVTQFVRDHTTLPLRRSILPYAVGVPHGSSEQGSVLWTMALRDLRPGAYFCLNCVEEDQSFHGTPYWRREHQMPGLYWCPKHGSPLNHLESKKAFLSSPADFNGDRPFLEEQWTDVLKESDSIQRFLTILSDLLATRQPLDERYVARRARERAMELGLHTGRGLVKNRLLSDLIKTEFDKPWLESVVPGIAEQTSGRSLHPVDRALLGKRAGVSAVVYALAFAALYTSANDATNAMMNRSAADSTTRTPLTASDQFDDGLLRKAYATNKGSHTEAAASIQANRSTITRRLDFLGLPALGHIDAGKVRDVIRLVLTGDMTLSAACAANSVPMAAIEVILRGGLSPLSRAIKVILPARQPKKRLGVTRRRPTPPPMRSQSSDFSPVPVVTRQASRRPDLKTLEVVE